MEDGESVEERTVVRRVRERASGFRLALAVVLIVVALGLIALGAFAVSTTAVRVVLILGGIALLAAFAYVAMGASHVGPGGRDSKVPGAELPHDETIQTTIRRKGFPKHGQMPAKHGKMPARGDDRPSRRRGGRGSGGTG